MSENKTPSTARKTPAKKAAPAKKAPAKKAAPKAEPIIKVPDWTPDAKKAVAEGRGRAAEHKDWTEEFALLNGYRVIPDPPFDNVVIFEKGDIRLRVTYSQGGFVRKVEGATSIDSRDGKKWIGLNSAIASLAYPAG